MTIFILIKSLLDFADRIIPHISMQGVIKYQSFFNISVYASILSNKFFFVSSIFSRSIFVMRIHNVTTLYHFRINFVFILSIFQPFSSFNFSTSFLFIVYIAISPVGRACIAWSLMVEILFSMG